MENGPKAENMGKNLPKNGKWPTARHGGKMAKTLGFVGSFFYFWPFLGANISLGTSAKIKEHKDRDEHLVSYQFHILPVTLPAEVQNTHNLVNHSLPNW